MTASWKEHTGAAAPYDATLPLAQLAEERAGWTWSAKLWLAWWLLVFAALLGSVTAWVEGPQAWQQWGRGLYFLGFLAGFVTLAPCLTWYGEHRIGLARELITHGPYATRRHRGWSLGGILWLVSEIVLPLIGFTLFFLQRRGAAKQVVDALIAFWFLTLLVLFFVLLAWVRRRVRTARAMEASYLMNFTYSEQLGFTHRPVWQLLPLFDRSQVQIAYHVMDGQVGSLPVSVLEWYDPQLAAKTGRSSHLLVIVPEGVRLPAFELQPRRVGFFAGQGWSMWFHLLHGPVGLLILFLHWTAHRLSQPGSPDSREVPLEHLPFFTRRYQLLSHDQADTGRLFSPELCDYFLAQKADWLVQSNGEQLVLCNLRASTNPRKHPQTVAECLRLAHHLQETYAAEQPME